MSWLAMVASWRCNPCLIRDNDAMAAVLKANHGFPTRPSAKKKASDQEFARWQTRNPKIDILRSILNQIMPDIKHDLYVSIMWITMFQILPNLAPLQDSLTYIIRMETSQ